MFTIAEELREVIDADHGLFKAMMDAVSQTLKQLVVPRRGAVPGVICVLFLRFFGVGQSVLNP